MQRLLVIPIALTLISCAEQASTPTLTQTLMPHRRSTATATIEPDSGILPVETMGPSPTALAHVIVEGDTLLSIAIRYGVELADLLLANPGVNPRLLIVGDNLNIPRSGAQGPVPSATPVPIELSPVACYEAIPEGLTCLLTASVFGDSAAEGVVALVTLADSAGNPIITEPAYGPMNLVLPGRKLPLVAAFSPQASGFTTASALAVSALNASGEDRRYAALDLQVDDTTISSDGQSARAMGSVEVLGENPERPVSLRLVVLAFGENEIPAGFRTWEAPEGGSLFDFEIAVFSLGPPIVALEVIAEAPYLP